MCKALYFFLEDKSKERTLPTFELTDTTTVRNNTPTDDDVITANLYNC